MVEDAFFKASVLSPTPESEEFWSSWMSESVERRRTFENARLIVIALHEAYEEKLDADEISRRVSQIKFQNGVRVGAQNNAVRKLYLYVAAASVLLIAAFIFFLSKGQKNPDRVGFERDGFQKDLQLAETENIRVNDTKSNMTLVLSDSSVVTLLPGSRLKFPERFVSDHRTVELSGDAFFEVARDPHSAFFVHAGSAVVKVLGTVFRVTARENEEEVAVKVLSGKVSVFSAGSDPENNGVVLLPNERLVLNTAKRTVETFKIIGEQEDVISARQAELVFDDTPLDEIFDQLSSAYGVEIEYDPSSFKKCPITTYFKDETLLERIHMVCQAVGASFRAENGKIIVTGIDCTGYEPIY